MIKVTKNGVPLAAIVSIEINDPLLRPYQTWAARDWYATIIPMPIAPRVMRGSLRLSEASLRQLREDFYKNWPEVAAFFPKK